MKASVTYHRTTRSALISALFLICCSAALTAQPRFDAQGIVYSARAGGGPIAVAQSGEVFVLEAAPSPDAPGTPGVFVVKLDHDARTVLYRTFLGHGTGAGIAADIEGSVYITGTARKGDFPETGSFTTAASTRAAFVVQLNRYGQRVYSVLVGGTNASGNAIAIDRDGNAYVTGTTSTADFPTTADAFDRTFGGGDPSAPTDAFVFKLNAAATGLVYSTYLGGTGNDEGAAIAVDDNGNAFVAGSTFSEDFPTTPGVLQPTPGAPPEEIRPWDAFLTKVNPAGTALVYSTYFGGNSLDHGRGVAVDAAGDAYLAVKTHSNDLPTTPGAAQTYQGNYDAYVLKLGASGSALMYGTYLGGTDAEEVGGIAVDIDGHASVTGTTQIWFYPTTPGAVLTERENSDFSDAFLTELNNAGGLVYSTYLGGSGNDVGVALALGPSHNVYVSGGSDSGYNAYTPGTATTVAPGSSGPFITKLVPLVSRTESASASTEAGISLPASAVVDADFTTRWASAATDTAWLIVDLGRRAAVERTIVHWAGSAYARSYQIDISDDGVAWASIAVGTSDGGIDDIEGSGEGRYVRISCTQRNDPSGYSIWEVDVYGEPAATSNQSPTVAITSPADGWTFIGPVTFDVEADASDVDGTVERVEFVVDGAIVATDTAPPYVHALTLADGTRTVAIRAIAYDNGGYSSTPAPQNSITVHQEALPTSWSTSEVGNTGRPGQASSVDGAIVLDAGGTDVWGAADAFYFMRRRMTGDADVIARVDSIERPSDAVFALAGVMFRESLAAGSRHAALVITTQGKAKFRRRTTTGGITSSDGPQSGTTFAPRWLKLSRRGNLFSAYLSTDGVAWTAVHTPQTIPLPSTLEVGILALRSGGAGRARATFHDVAITAPAAPLPPGWQSRDIGVVGQPGSVVESNGTFIVRGAGADVWGTADAFHYAYQSLTGNGTIVARAATMSGTQAWTKIGVMIRASSDPGAAYAFMLLSVGKGLAFQRRTTQGGMATHTYGGSGTAPRWVRLRRDGNTIVASSSVDGAVWTEVGRDTFVMAPTVLIGLAVSSHTTTALATATFDHVTITTPATPLPSGWQSRDVGATGQAGSAVERDGTFTVKGAGADVWGTADAFHYAYQSLTGDGTIVARVATISGTQAWTKMGVMMRASTDPGAAYAFMLVSLSKGLAFQRRTVAGAPATHTSGGGGTAPRWVRLQRAGNTIVASVSSDGAAWTEVGRDAFTMGSTVLIGLAAHSHTTSALATATFDHVTITPGQFSGLAIAHPAPGSVLRTTTARFEWNGSGDEFWLNMGTAAGGSDLYASGSLGQVTQHVVTGLPLNGMTLYVQLRRRVGTVIDVVNVRYTAPIRRGLLVITDFADRRLEDWTGAGMNNIEDVSVQLRAMEAHWDWLSRGLERIEWDIIRVTLTQPCVPGVFPGGWPEFRSTVAALVRQQVAVADYDVNGDGAIDSAWLIVSSGEIELDFSIGGSSLNGGVNMFADGQASRSVTSGATGNFNHELGHLMGLVDMYGDYDTVHGLTLMSFSWPVPPHDFAAYERMKLGWLEPVVLAETTRDVWLPSAHETFAAVKVPTARAEEYFLIEYRKRPESGYGSQNPFFNGLAVYHVLEGSSMWQDPPIVKLEPADGSIRHSDGLNQADFVYPDNPNLLRPMVLRSYFGGAPEIFRIENVTWRDGGIAFDIIVAAAAPMPPNLFANASFESGDEGTGTPDGWTRSGSAGFTWPSPIALAGARSAMLETPSPNDLWWSQSVALTPGHSYRLCGWLKGEGIGPPGGTGGSMSVIGALGGWVGSPGLTGTFDWTQGCVMFTTNMETSRADIGCRLGHYLERVSGKLWCDALTLEHLRSAF